MTVFMSLGWIERSRGSLSCCALTCLPACDRYCRLHGTYEFENGRIIRVADTGTKSVPSQLGSWHGVLLMCQSCCVFCGGC